MLRSRLTACSLNYHLARCDALLSAALCCDRGALITSLLPVCFLIAGVWIGTETQCFRYSAHLAMVSSPIRVFIVTNILLILLILLEDSMICRRRWN